MIHAAFHSAQSASRHPSTLLRLSGLVLLLLCACKGPLAELNAQANLSTVAGPFELKYAAGDTDGVTKISRAVEHAAPRLAQWGGLRDRVTIHILPTHAALEDAVNHPGYTWLRAWAKYDSVYVQTPKTWSLFGASQADVDELILHELTHCVMYQASANRTNWTRKQIPLWFREGMASYTASQGYRWPSLEDLARYDEEDPGRDPVSSPESLYQHDNDIVYAAAHHAFTFLAHRYGEDRVRQILAQMAGGKVFPDAFEAVIGIPVAAFTEDFKRYVRLRGFRGGRLIHPVSAVSPDARVPQMEVEDWTVPDAQPTGCVFR